MIEVSQKFAGLQALLKAQAVQMIGQCSALTGDLLTKDQKQILDVEEARKKLQEIEKNDDPTPGEFQRAHQEVQAIQPKLKELVASLDSDQKKKYEKKAEKKIQKNTMTHRNELQKQLDDLTANLNDQQKHHLQHTMSKLQPQQQEQMIAEMGAQKKSFDAMSPTEQARDQQETLMLQGKFQLLLQQMDVSQQKMIMAQMQAMMPSAQKTYMKKICEGGAGSENLLPPAEQESKNWKVLYPCYYNSQLSHKQGRVYALKYCVKNPQISEFSAILKEMGIRHVNQGGKRHPKDFLHVGRIKFKFYDNLGNPEYSQYKSKNQIMQEIANRLPNLNTRTDETLALKMEKQGVFDFAAEEAKISQTQQQQMPPGMSKPSISGGTKADKRKSQRKK